MANLVFNARTVAPAVSGGSQLPVSDENGHHVKITNTLVKPTKGNDGGYLELELTVVSGPNAGASGPKRLNLYNPSQKAVEIAYAELSAVCHCIGRLDIQNHEDLRGGECRAIVKQQTDPKYTEVKGFLDLQGNTPDKIAAMLAGGAPQAAQQPQNTGFQQPQQAAAPAQQPTQGAQWGQQQQQPQEQQQQNAAWGQQPQPVQNVPMPGQQPQQQFNQQPAAATPPWGAPK